MFDRSKMCSVRGTQDQNWELLPYMYRSLLGMKEIRMSKVEVLQYHVNTTVKKKKK